MQFNCYMAASSLARVSSSVVRLDPSRSDQPFRLQLANLQEGRSLAVKLKTNHVDYFNAIPSRFVLKPRASKTVRFTCNPRLPAPQHNKFKLMLMPLDGHPSPEAIRDMFNAPQQLETILLDV
jgi:hypothetical protein